MSEFLVDADVMVRAKFGVSQLAETVAALKMLGGGLAPATLRGWRTEHLPAFYERLKGDPVSAALVASAFGPHWTADFLTVPPAALDLTLAEELVELESIHDDRVRSDLEVVRRPLPPDLAANQLAATAADLLRWVWDTTVLPTWTNRSRLLRADIVSRTSRLSRQGWSGALEGLAEGVRWLGSDRLQVNQHPFPPRDIRGSSLMFIPAHSPGAWVSWRLPDRYAITYPVTGALAEALVPHSQPLARLLGTSRASVLLNARHPVSTSTLVATCRLPLGSVGGHLRVLLDAGLLERRRSGREVLYWWSNAAHALIQSAHMQGHPGADRP